MSSGSSQQNTAHEQGYSAVWVAILVLLVGMIVTFVWYVDRDVPPEHPAPPDNDTGTIDTSAWVTYTSEHFSFSIQHPDEWEVATSNGPMAPLFTFYRPPLPEGTDAPLTHHDSGTHVSVYPEGIPTEGIFGETAPTSVTLAEVELEEGLDYQLTDGTPWATLLQFEVIPASWNQSGFVFARQPIHNLDIYCQTDTGERIEIEECDPLGPPEPITVKREGSIDRETRDIIEAMLATFTFTE